MAKQSMVGNMSKPATVPSPSLDDLVYGPPATSPPPLIPTPNVELLKPTRVVFTNQLTPERYLQVQQYAHWGRTPIADILDEALAAYFANKPDADRELPEKIRAKVLKKLGK